MSKNRFFSTRLLLTEKHLVLTGLILIISACAKPGPVPGVDEVVEQALPETTEIAQSFSEVPSWADIIAQGAVKDG